jgi:hypothetical protein
MTVLMSPKKKHQIVFAQNEANMKACKDIIINLDAITSPSLKTQLTHKKTIINEDSSDDDALKSKKRVAQMPLIEQTYF